LFVVHNDKIRKIISIFGGGRVEFYII